MQTWSLTKCPSGLLVDLEESCGFGFWELLDEAQARFGWSVFLSGLRKQVKVVEDPSLCKR